MLLKSLEGSAHPGYLNKYNIGQSLIIHKQQFISIRGEEVNKETPTLKSRKKLNCLIPIFMV